METGLVDGVLPWQGWRGRRLRATTVAGQSSVRRSMGAEMACACAAHHVCLRVGTRDASEPVLLCAAACEHHLGPGLVLLGVREAAREGGDQRNAGVDAVAEG